jgi:hypothetical protein
MWTKKTIIKGIVAFNILNAFDAIFTLVWILKGFATEGNPLMGILIDVHPVLFFVVKVFAIGALVSWILWKARNERTAKFGILMALILYGFIALCNIGFIGFLMFK